MPVYKVNKIVFLDKFTKCYKNIFTISNPPNDISLNNITQTISQNKLSPFQTFSSCCNNPSCVRIFIKVALFNLTKTFNSVSVRYEARYATRNGAPIFANSNVTVPDVAIAAKDVLKSIFFLSSNFVFS